MAALATGKRTPQQAISDPGYFWFGNHKFRDDKEGGHGSVDMYRSIVQSCDTYYYTLAADMGVDMIRDQLQPFGFGTHTGIDLIGEVRGALPSTEWKRKMYKRPELQRWYAGETISLGIGQGYNNFTVLQMAQATATLANGGVHYRPRIVREIEDAVTKEVRLVSSEAMATVPMKPENLEVIRHAMVGVNKEGTSATAFRGTSYVAAGKTGTAQVVAIKQNEKYNASKVAEHLRDHALYIAFAPAEEPRIALALVVENAGFGAQSAAPIARRVFDYWLSGLYPSEEDIAGVQQGQASIPLGTPRPVSGIPVTPVWPTPASLPPEVQASAPVAAVAAASGPSPGRAAGWERIAKPASHDPGMHSGSFSPYWYLGQVPGRVNIYSVSGWYDGSAFANGAIARFLSNPGADNRLLLGPWDHGARTNGSPWRDGPPQPQFPVLGEVLRFFDEHLAGMSTGLQDEAPVHFHTMRDEKWQAATTWPPHEASVRLFLAEGNRLAPTAPRHPTTAQYQVRFTTSTGPNSRFERLGALAVADYYKDWHGREDGMLTFVSAPFDEPTELSGHATVQLHVSTSEHDGGVFVYLSEVEASGRCWYITEGLLRLLHRAEAKPPASYQTTWPYRTFQREHAKHMQPGVRENARFALLPVSWTLQAGSRLQLAIAGADADHFAQVTHGRPPCLEFTIGGEHASSIDLPLRP